MDYRPDETKHFLWDTWMFPDPDGARMHLFYLAKPPDEPWQHIAHLVSDDLVHWQEMPSIMLRRPRDNFDVGIVGTGMVFQDPGGGYLMSYTTNLEGPVQRIAFLHSDDLNTWHKRWPEPRIEAKPPFYETDPASCVCNPPAFRDAYIHHVGNHYEALIAAHSGEGSRLLSACIARYRSVDNELRNWEPLPPLFGPGVAMLMEVPEYFRIGDKHYLLWSTAYRFGADCSSEGRRECWGTFYAMSDSYEGPYEVPRNSLLVGAGCYPTWHAIVARTVRWSDDLLLYHHMSVPHPSLAFPKRILQQHNGTLTVAYWPGLEAVHSSAIRLPLDRLEVQGENIRVGDWEAMDCDAVRVSIAEGGILALIPCDLKDIHLRCRVTLDSGTRFGISLRDPCRNEKKGVALQADLKYGEWQFGVPHHSWTSRIQPVESVREALQVRRTYQLDLIVRDIYFEAYVDGIWKFSRIINDHSPSGGVGFYVYGGSARFEQIQVWGLEQMVHPVPSEQIPGVLRITNKSA